MNISSPLTGPNIDTVTLLLHSELILDLDWSSTPDMQSILAVGYAHRVEIICQQRMTYFADELGWSLYRTIDISGYVSLRVYLGGNFNGLLF